MDVPGQERQWDPNKGKAPKGVIVKRSKEQGKRLNMHLKCANIKKFEQEVFVFSNLLESCFNVVGKLLLALVLHSFVQRDVLNESNAVCVEEYAHY